jgi:hypothetical protein
MAAAGLAAASLDAGAYRDHVKYLASEELEGRGTGSKGLEKAAAYIERHFRAAGLKPVNGSSYRQAFEVTTKVVRKGPNTLRVTRGKQTVKLDANAFTPLDMSESGRAAADLVFAGYGITAPEHEYDDYAGLDVKGKVVLVLRYEPQEFDDNSKFLGRRATRHASLNAKVTNAKIHGAKALIVVADRPVGPSDGDKLASLGGLGAPAPGGIPVVMVRTAVVKEWFRAAGQDLESLVKAVDGDLKPRPLDLGARVDLQTSLARVQSTVHNVVGYLPGASGEHVILGAHYDHIGLGGQYSLAPKAGGQVHHGADDNASGTAALLELAKYFGAQPAAARKRGMLFLAFASEEIGLLGSAHYAANPLVPLEKATTMINMDMVGRLRDGKLMIGSASSGAGLTTVLDEVKTSSSLALQYGEEGGMSAGSDHTSFLQKKVPALFFFTGLHQDYHRPSDTWDKINAEGAVQVMEVVARTAERLRDADAKVAFVAPPPAKPGSSAAGSGGGGYGAVFGCLPDMGFSGKGVRCSEFRAGTPADVAGLKGGDVMIEFDGKEVGSLQDYAYLLGAHKPGDKVTVKVTRDGKPIDFQVTLGSRR